MPNPQAEYRLSPGAEQDIEGIWKYTFKAWGLDQANRYIDELITALSNIATNPLIGQKVDHIRKGYHRTRVGRHAIYYYCTDYGIAVIRILHDRMLPVRHLPGREAGVQED